MNAFPSAASPRASSPSRAAGLDPVATRRPFSIIFATTARAGRTLSSCARLLTLLLAVAVLSACASTPTDRIAYNTVDDAVTGVQQAVRAYKEHCGVPRGAAGPGTCNAQQYEKAQAAYVKFQATADSAASIAEAAGKTPLDVVIAAAAEALQLINAWRRP